MKITQLFRIEEGNLRGTEIMPIGAMLGVYYPHRKTGDLYIAPLKDKTNTFHCCQERCSEPDFPGDMESFVGHLRQHAGRLFKKLPPIGRAEPRVVVTLPENPWAENDKGRANSDRRFVVELYRDTLKRALAKQGVGVLEAN